MRRLHVLILLLAGLALAADARAEVPEELRFFDSHFHLTNYIQEGITAQDFLKLMGDRVGRSTLFGIPLQQQWSYSNSQGFAPKYYLDTDAPLYYYSFVDAAIAEAWRKLDPESRKRFDPMITGFNPADMYAVDHVKRVLRTFPGVFEGIGEFTIHKEFVSAKIAGGGATLADPALDRLLDFAAEAGLVALIHNDIQVPFPKDESKSPYALELYKLFARHPQTTIIWAHLGLGRVVRPPKEYGRIIEHVLQDPGLNHVYFDLSWDEVAKYLQATPDSLKNAANLINRYPDRFLFGTDTVAPKGSEDYYRVFEMYAPLWKALKPETSRKVRYGNYERLFDAARKKVRAWEAAHAGS